MSATAFTSACSAVGKFILQAQFQNFVNGRTHNQAEYFNSLLFWVRLNPEVDAVTKITELNVLDSDFSSFHYKVLEHFIA